MSSREQEDNFFKLYKAFLFADSHKSLLMGRERDIIRSFFAWYLGFETFDKDKRSKLSSKLFLYFKDNGLHCIKFIPYQYQCSKSRIEPHRTNIECSTKILQNAIRHYILWRKILKYEDVIGIAKCNIIDRIQYYFTIPQEQLEKLFEEHKNNNTEEQSITVPRQVLIEFHNAISHLIQAGEGKKGDDNIPRACNHFKRGALDLYKIIIKDFFILYPFQCQQNTKEIQKKLCEIRVKEYELIGDDEGRVSNAKSENNSKIIKPQLTLFDEYCQLTQKIIKFYSKKH